MKELLKKLNACQPAREWASNKSIDEIWATCHRGDWMLWLARKLDIDKRVLTLAKGHCANTVRHLMKDERSITAVDMAIKYGEGNATDSELAAAADAAYDAADAAYAYDAAFAADAFSAYAAADAADAYDADAADAYDAAAAAAYVAAAAATAAYVAAAAAAYTADAAADADARKKSQQATAEICRKYIPLDLILAAIKSQEKQKDGI